MASSPRARFVLALAATLAATGAFAQVEEDLWKIAEKAGIGRPTRTGNGGTVRTSKGNSGVTMDAAAVTKSIDSAIEAITQAIKIIDTTEPAYAGRRQEAKYTAQFAYENLNSAKNYHRGPANGGPRSATGGRLSVRERMKTIPAAREKSRREFTSAAMANSDKAMNDAGVKLLDAREAIAKTPDVFDGLMNESRQFLDTAISDIERSIGRIRRPAPVKRR